MDFRKLLKSVRAAYTREKLSGESSRIIEAYRQHNDSLLRQYAALVEIGKDGTAGRMFQKIIPHYHPDRYSIFHREIDGAEKSGDREVLEKLARHMALPPYSEINNHLAPVSHREEYRAEIIPEEQDTDYYGREQYGFVEAMNDIYFGNQPFRMTPEDLESFEGSLDLCDTFMEDLEGLDYCRGLTELNLSGCGLLDAREAFQLPHLEILDLSRNQVISLEGIQQLEHLEFLDISGNPIDDLEPLLGLESPLTVLCTGCPVTLTEKQRREFSERGILILR